MSTDYKIACKECKKTGSWFSRQAWGTGNAPESLDIMRFMMYHTVNCGPENVIIVQEQTTAFDDWYSQDEKELHGVFPHSNDWSDYVLSRAEQEEGRYLSNYYFKEFLEEDVDEKLGVMYGSDFSQDNKIFRYYYENGFITYFSNSMVSNTVFY